MSTKIFFPHLDGLRFVAFFAVFVNHVANSLGHHSSSPQTELFKYKYLSNGDLGVSFFFVLSGFLITYLLLRERESKGMINIPGFYMRRVLRIWPVYFLVVLLCLFIVPLLAVKGLPMRITVAKLNPYFYLTFLGNFDFIYHGITNSLIAPLWSVSVEEQFYLVWPLLIAWIPRRALVPVMFSLIGLSLAYRIFAANGIAVCFKYHTFSSVADLSSGALLAVFSINSRVCDRIRSMPRWLIILLYAGGILLFLSKFYLQKIWPVSSPFAVLMPFGFTLFFVFVIAEQNFAENSFYKTGKNSWIPALGKYTYGMYCYHMLVFFAILLAMQFIGIPLAIASVWELIVIAALGLTATIYLSKISYRYLESPLLRLKSKFSA